MEETIKIYNSLTRQKEPFRPINPPQVNMYVCGPTVYDEPHIGHARSAYIFDVIRRYLQYRDYNVKFVRNVTDVDDKIIDKAKKEYPNMGLISAVKEVSTKYLNAYHNDMKVLGITEPDVEPKATEYIDKMIKFIENLINKGVAYESGGDVYFDIKKAKEYGKLSHQSLDKMEVGARVLPGENKKDLLDFALWKSAKEGEPSWYSPWRKGRPGWHIECSVMSSDILGNEFDIHGGGIDLIFPHHENEIAQSEGAGNKFAKYWIHHGLLTINGQKMAKSLGNFITIKDIIKKYNSDILKLFFLSANYASPIDFSWEKMEQFKSAYERFTILFNKLDKQFRGANREGSDIDALDIHGYRKRFEEAMDDDFNMPGAIRTLFELVSYCNILLEKDKKDYELAFSYSVITNLGSILGLSFKYLSEEVPDCQISILIEKRAELKKEGKFKEADLIRTMLEQQGIILEDTKDGTTWRRKL